MVRGSIFVFARLQLELKVNAVALNMTFEELFGELERAVDPEVVERLPKELQVSPVDVLDNNRAWLAPTCDPDYEPEYKGLLEKHKMLRKQVMDLLPAGYKEMLGELENVMLAMESINVKFAFRQGLRDGVGLAGFVLDSDRKRMKY
ncbi:MAG: hypothetical protein A4E53_00391 [Pelotomaculum sp. PtaB.Bin104]|nr:MAG: hypothetical protein A4E53_00391 [Pelotomaculum sp. PtaB.Bin104]